MWLFKPWKVFIGVGWPGVVWGAAKAAKAHCAQNLTPGLAISQPPTRWRSLNAPPAISFYVGIDYGSVSFRNKAGSNLRP